MRCSHVALIFLRSVACRGSGGARAGSATSEWYPGAAGWGRRPHGDAVAAGRTGTRRSEQHLLGMATAVATLVCTDNYSIERREAWYATESYERGMMHAMELQQRIG